MRVVKMSLKNSKENITTLEKYYTDILDNKILGSDKLKQASEIILNDFYNPNEFHFDIDIAHRHTDFIETFCKIPAGKLGAPFILEPFQKAMLEVAFGFVDDNNLRQYQEVFEVIGRKNGKTCLCSAIELDLLVNDNEGAPQIYNVATKHDQALLGFNHCVNIRNLSPLLKKHIKKRQSDLFYAKNLGYIKALSSKTASLDGLDVHGGIIDELAAIRDRDLYDLIKQGTSARMQPILFEITTNGFHRNGIFDSQYEYATKVLNGEIIDRRFLALIYELNSVDDAFDFDKLIMANPGLGTIKDPEKLKANMQKAIDDPSFRPTYLVKDCNIKQTNESAWLRMETIENPATVDISKFMYAVGGFDAADSIDLNAAKALCMRPNDDHIYVESMYWIPESVIEKQKATRRERDNAPYELWIQQGYMRSVPGNSVDKRVFLDWFIELRNEKKLYTLFIGYDPWHISDELLRAFKQNFGQNSMIPIRQGVQTLSEPMKNIAADLESNKIVYNDNPIDKWCLINTNIKTDINGNIQPIKGRDSRNRIDGTVALICGYKALKDNADKYVNHNYGVNLE